jgi:hypothetical protein
MEPQRWIAVKGRMGVLACLLGCAGLLIPAQADARRMSRAWGGAGGGEVGRASGHGAQGRRGKSRRHKKAGASGVTATATRSKSHRRSGAGAAERRQAKLACVDAFDKAKEAANVDHLRAANEWFALCAEATCAGSLRKRCTAVHTKIAAMLPSVVPVVNDPTGATGGAAEVRMDGEMLTTNLDGSAIVVDHGEHQFTFSKDGEIFATRKVSIQKSQRGQVVSATYQPKEPEPEPAPVVTRPVRRKAAVPALVAENETAPEAGAGEEPEPRVVRRAPAHRATEEAAADSSAPFSAYALAGVGLLGVGGYVTLNLKGSAENDALKDLCSPDCRPESVRKVRNIYLLADASLALGLGALAASTYLFFRSPDSAEEQAKPRSRVSLSGASIAPTSSGAFATVGGTF